MQTEVLESDLERPLEKLESGIKIVSNEDFDNMSFSFDKISDLEPSDAEVNSTLGNDTDTQSVGSKSSSRR